MERNATVLFLPMLIILACFAVSIAVKSDIDCLRSIKESLEDPEQHLSSWDFSNYTEGFICRFTGVECWHPDESKVLNIDLSGMRLRGPFPIGVKNCTALTGLDISGNSLSGNIPFNVSDVMQFVTSLDLSNNNFSGQIPPELSKLERIKVFSVANNQLSGKVPEILDFTAESYANNLRLCGAPLSRCENDGDRFIIGFAVGCPLFTILTILVIFCYQRSMSNMRFYILMMKKIKERKLHQIRRISQPVLVSTEESKITDMEKLIRPLSLVELKLATNDFDIKNVIGYGNMGLMYKAVFQNGLVLAVKRLLKFESFEKEFAQEIEVLGRLRHKNLVPLISFCFEMEKKFLVYKYIFNGTLHQWLHSKPQVEGKKMGWNLRLSIAVGIARGLAWLHHNNVLRVAHLKISSHCILLDHKFEPKISNFGNSNILMNSNSTLLSGCTFVDSPSCPDPYKEDVYNFGILLLELVSGKERPSAVTDSDSLRDECGDEFNMIDECLMGRGSDEEICETLRIAENCVQTYKDGTTSMLQVYQAIHAIGRSRNEISFGSYMDLEGNEGDV